MPVDEMEEFKIQIYDGEKYVDISAQPTKKRKRILDRLWKRNVYKIPFRQRIKNMRLVRKMKKGVSVSITCKCDEAMMELFKPSKEMQKEMQAIDALNHHNVLWRVINEIISNGDRGNFFIETEMYRDDDGTMYLGEVKYHHVGTEDWKVLAY